MRLSFIATTAAALTAAFAAVGQTGATPKPSCAATPVWFAPSKHPTFGQTPWMLARPGNNGIVGYLPSYGRVPVGGPRLPTKPLVVGRAGLRTLWLRFGPSATTMSVTAALLGRREILRFEARLQDGVFPLRLSFPSAGCWRLTVRIGTARSTVVARARG